MDNKKKRFVAYYRVSTQQQGRSGLGLEAQESAVKSHAKGDIIASFTEIESGKKASRTQLENAIQSALTNDATLIVAKLDRLSRDVLFIARLMKSKVKFECCDMPEANSFTIHIFAAMAEHEQKMISERTRAALKAAKARGTKLGNPKADKAFMDRIRAQRQPKQYDPTLIDSIKDKLKLGKPYHQIASEVNELGHKSLHQKPFSATAIWRIAKTIA